MEHRHSHADRRKHHVIYKTTCKVTSKYYVGMHSTDNLQDGYIGSGKRLWRSIKKHGVEQHVCEVLEHLPSREALRMREAELVNDKLLQDPLCMNLALGGGNLWNTARRYVKSNRQRGESIKAFWSSSKGLEVRERYRQTPRPFPEASKPLASKRAIERMARMKADGSWAQVITKNRAAHTGKTLTTAHKQKLGEANRRYKELHGPKVFSEQARANISKSLVGEARNRKKWRLIELMTGAELIVENLSGWLREHNLRATNVYVKNSVGVALYKLGGSFK